LAQYLIRAGLTTEPANARKEAPLKGAMNINLKMLGTSAQTGASGQASGTGGSGGAEPLPKNYVFCFATKFSVYLISEKAACGASQKNAGVTLEADAPPTVSVDTLCAGECEKVKAKVKALPECNDGSKYPQYDSDENYKYYKQFCDTMRTFAKDKKQISFAFYPKSAEAVIYYLGEVARRQLYPDPFDNELKSFAMMIRTAPVKKPEDYKLETCVQPPPHAPGDQCQYLFRIENSVIPSGALSVYYNGMGYSVFDYPGGGGYSMSSLEIVKQLVALFSSAKTLPQTTVLNVVGSP